MSAIFGFTFHIGRMTEVLTPDIYRELTGPDTQIVLNGLMTGIPLELNNKAIIYY